MNNTIHKERGGRGWAFFLLLPVVLLLLVSLILPSLWALYLGFTEYRLGRTPRLIGFQNYITILRDVSGFWDPTIRTLVFTAAIVAGEFIVGFLIALLLARKFRFQKLWVSLIIAPMAVSPVVAIIIWKYMLSPNYGMINYILTSLGFPEPNWFASGGLTFFAIVMIDVWMESPFVFTMLYPALISISPSLFEAARIDGANYIQIQRHITFPLLKPVIITTMVFRVIFGLRMFEPIYLFSGGGPVGATKVFSIYLYEQAFMFWHFGKGSAIAWLLLLITTAIAMPQIRVMQRTMFGTKRENKS
jgi:multiple sugar transport system permease protein